LTEFAPPPGTGSVVIDAGGVNIFENNVETITATPFLTMSFNNDLEYAFGDVGGAAIKPNNNFQPNNGQSMTWCDAYRLPSSPGTDNVVWLHGSTVAGGNNASLATFQPIPSIGGSSTTIRRVRRPGFKWM